MPITDEVREKIKQTMIMNGGNTNTEKAMFSRGAEYGYSLALAELETFKDAYVERNDECNRLKAELEVLKAENERLKQWKKEAMPMMEDFQAIGKALGIPLGQSIHDKILPGIEAKDKRIAELEGLVAWYDMESAPKDGTEIFLADVDGVHKVTWQDISSAPGEINSRKDKRYMAWCVVGSYGDEQGGFWTIDNPILWQPIHPPFTTYNP